MYLAVSIFLVWLPLMVLIKGDGIQFMFIHEQPIVGILIAAFNLIWVQWTIRQFKTAYSRSSIQMLMFFFMLIPFSVISIDSNTEFIMFENNLFMVGLYWLNSILLFLYQSKMPEVQTAGV